MKILIIEDEPNVAAFIKKGLEENGFEVLCATDGANGYFMAEKITTDLIILDLVLPGMNGLEVCKRLRSKVGFKTPVLMLTALGTTDDIVLGLETGADDYLIKPFKFKELLARIHALLRRGQASGSQNIIRIADLEINNEAKTVSRSEQPIKLTAKEFNLLNYLVLNKGRVVSRMDILENVWEIDFDLGTNVVDVYVNYLRNKIDKNFSPKLIHTVVGMGYVVREE